ncbi:MAG: fimbria major subunit [Muribaculaceae bacterium]|nr:fimbria major subunit [Muribaculaceae bacterium]
MNKFAKLFAGMAVISLAASCSSDEPMGTTGGNDNAEGSTLYLAVNIQDATSSMGLASAPSKGRAEEEDGDRTGADGGYGNLNNADTEHKVNSARFFFFDEKGVFVTEANVWSDGAPTNGNVNNVEFKSTAMVVLKGLKEKSLPKYMFTIVNCPADFQAAATLEETARQTADINNGQDYFVMSTSSFNPNDTQLADKTYNSKYPYANYVTESSFYTEPKEIADIANPVIVYVERLATKTTFEMVNKTQPVTVTVAGNPNGEDEEKNDNVAKTTLYVTIDGFAVTNVETESYIAKNIDGFNGLESTFGANALGKWSWNKADDFRSTWGMSTTYGQAAPALKHIAFAEAAKHDVAAPYYSYETTNTLANVDTETHRVKDANVPCVIFSATVTSDKDGKNPVDLVEYNGVYFLEGTFVEYGLNRLKGDTNGLNFYTYVGTSTDPSTDNDIKNYEGIPANFVTIHKKGTSAGVVELCANRDNIADTKLYAKNGEKFEPTTIEALNTRLAEFTAEGSAQAIAARTGKTYYTVPVKHLRANTALTEDKPYQVNAEGQYGMVRNHWYQISVDKIMKLGHGVYDPDDDNEIIEPEDPEDDTYGLGAKINILSWKIVKQNVNL